MLSVQAGCGLLPEQRAVFLNSTVLAAKQVNFIREARKEAVPARQVSKFPLA